MNNQPPKDEGWYIATPPNPARKSEIVRVRLDLEKQSYVVDVVGQDWRYSDDLERYGHWKWTGPLDIEFLTTNKNYE